MDSTGFFNSNDMCADFLKELATLYNERNESFRATAFDIASEVIRTYPEDINCVPNFKHLEGVGKSINEEIKQFLETGTSMRFELMKPSLEK